MIQSQFFLVLGSVVFVAGSISLLAVKASSPVASLCFLSGSVIFFLVSWNNLCKMPRHMTAQRLEMAALACFILGSLFKNPQLFTQPMAFNVFFIVGSLGLMIASLLFEYVNLFFIDSLFFMGSLLAFLSSEFDVLSALFFVIGTSLLLVTHTRTLVSVKKS